MITDEFPWFLAAYMSYTRRVQRSDVARYMLLYLHGGLYLDADVRRRCFHCCRCYCRLF
jgi:mannosyltransferase OCH1-like enzyme